MQTQGSASTESGTLRENVRRAIARIVADQSEVPADRIKETDHMVNDLGCDSLAMIEIAMEVEEEFDITIPEEEAEELQTVGEMVDGVLDLLGRSE